MRPAAGNAFLRPDQKRSRSASVCDTDAAVEPAAPARARLRDLLGDFFGRAVGFGKQDRLGI